MLLRLSRPLKMYLKSYKEGIPWQASGQDLALSLLGPGFDLWSGN